MAQERKPGIENARRRRGREIEREAEERKREAAASVPSKCIRCQKWRGDRRLEARGWMCKGGQTTSRRGRAAAFRRGTCHFEARPWGRVAYHRAEIFQQTSLSFHLPNADGSPTPVAPDRARTCNAAGNYRALFSTLAISTARARRPPPAPFAKRTRALRLTQRNSKCHTTNSSSCKVTE